MKLRSISDIEVRGKRVLLRTGLNVPISGGRVVDDFRLARAVRTMELLLARGARVIVLAHIGRGGESLKPIAEALGRKLHGTRPTFIAEGLPSLNDVAALRDGELLMLENVRKLPGEEENDPMLAQSLAALADIYVNDAFSDSHRTHASVVGVAALLPSYAGLLVIEEVERLEEALSPARPAIAVIGGAKFETKEPLIKKLSELYDRVCVGGAIVNDFFRAKGYEIGVSLSSERLPKIDDLLAHPHIELPMDIIVTTGTSSRAVLPTEVRPGERIADAGPGTGARWATYIKEAGFVLINGPLGIYERGFNAETERLAHALAESKAHAVVGGGDTIAALEKTNFDPERVFLSTGGGSMLQFIADGTLPGLEALKKS